MADHPYIGKIKNTGSQKVDGNVKSDNKQPVKKTGKDLRCGK